MLDRQPNTEDLKLELTATPSEFFNRVKDSINTLDKIQLQHYLSAAHKILEKAKQTGQRSLAHRLEFKINTLKIEMALNNLGVNKYVNRDDILNYMDNVEHRVVKLAEVKDYLREIPDEAIEIMKRTTGYFSDYLILYTDYTDELGKQVEQKKKDKDPILFGIFYDELFKEVTERFYFLYDWVDEYCDLTLDKMIEEYKDLSADELVHYSTIDFKAERQDLKEFKAELYEKA